MELKNIETYIAHLLLEHDCVIVPAFGGFVARQASAQFAKTGNMLLPPAKSIVFNKNLINNDGLLAGHIMQKEEISYPQANMAIELFVNTCKQQLTQQKRFEITLVGILYKNAENTILFEQDTRVNYNPQAFGLPTVKAIKLVVEEKKVTPPVLNYREKIEAAAVKPKVTRRIVMAASMAAIIISLLFFATKQNPLNGGLASFSPFSASNKTNSVSENKITPVKTPEKVVVKSIVEPDTASVDKTIVAKANVTITEWYKQPYQIVVGCFAVKQNAFKLINQLQSQNLEASIAGQNAKNLYVVSIAGYTDETAARKKLSEMKQQYPSAWLFKR